MLRLSTSEQYYEAEKGIRGNRPSVEAYESTVDTVKIWLFTATNTYHIRLLGTILYVELLTVAC
jgi:hypothetical protein